MLFAYLEAPYPEGIDNPFNTSDCEYLLFVCMCCLRCVAWFSNWFDNLDFTSKGNTYRRCVASSLPLWGNTDVASRDIKRNFWPVVGEDLQHIPGSKSQISSPHNLHYFPFASRFSLPHLTKICCFIRVPFCSPFSC